MCVTRSEVLCVERSVRTSPSCARLVLVSFPWPAGEQWLADYGDLRAVQVADEFVRVELSVVSLRRAGTRTCTRHPRRVSSVLALFVRRRVVLALGVTCVPPLSIRAPASSSD